MTSDQASQVVESKLRGLANPRCSVCAGKGRFLSKPLDQPEPTVSTCACAQKGYDKRVSASACSICGVVGFCEHRPRSLQDYISSLFLACAAPIVGAHHERRA